MTDLLLQRTDRGFDLVLEGDDLAPDPGLRTAVLVSLFSDARADEELQAELGERDPRGWWPDSADDRFGSLLWTLARAKATAITAERARAAAAAGLDWLLREEIAERVTVSAAWRERGLLEVDVAIARGRAPRWRALWEGVEQMELELGGVLVRVTP